MAAQQRLVALLEHYRNRLHGLGDDVHDEELEYVHQILSSPLFRLYKAGVASHEDTNKIMEATKEVLSGMEATDDHQLSPGEKRRRQLLRRQSLKALRNVVTPSSSPLVQSKGSSGRKLSQMQATPSDAQQDKDLTSGDHSHSGEARTSDSFNTFLEHSPAILSVESDMRPRDVPRDVGPIHSTDNPQRLPLQVPPSYPQVQVPPPYPQVPPSSYSHPSLISNKKVRSVADLPTVIDFVSHTSSPLPPPSPHSGAPPVTEAMVTRNTPTAENRRPIFTVHLEKGEEGLGFRVKGVKSEQKGDGGGIFIQDLQPGGIAERNGQLKRNDQIISINGYPLEGIPHADAVKLLQGARGLVELVVSREQHMAPPLSSYEYTSSKTHSQDGVHSKISQPQKIETIELSNEGYGFGFGVIPSKDVGIVIHSILPGGVADRDGRLRQNDRLLQINESAVRHVSYEAVVSMLREISQSGRAVRLVVGRVLLEQEETKALEMSDVQSSDEDMEKFRVELCKPLGITIAGLVHPDTGDEVDGIYITRLNPNGAAAQHGGILEGDRILEVDGQSLSGMENMEAAAILRNSGNLVKLVLARKRKVSSQAANTSPQPAGVSPTVGGDVMPPPIDGDVVSPPVHGNVVSPPGGGDVASPPVHGDVVSPPGGGDVASPPVCGDVVSPPGGGDVVSQLVPSIRVPPPADNDLPTVNIEQPASLPVDDNHLLSPPVPFNSLLPPAESGLVESSSVMECAEQEEKEENVEQLLKKWSEHLGPNKVVKAIQLSRESREQSLGILMESTAQLDDGGIGSTHHVIQHIHKDGLIGQHGILQEGDEILEVNGTVMRGLEHSQAAEVLKAIEHKAVIVVCHPCEEELSAIGSETTLQDIVADSDQSGTGDHSGTGDEGGTREALKDQHSPTNTSSESLPQLFDFTTPDDFSRRFERQSWRERHEVERRRLKQQFEKRREEYERHIREQEEELLQQERELREHQLQQAQEEERQKFGADKRSSALLQDTDFDYSSYHSPYMMHQSPDSGGRDSSASMLSPVPGSGLWESEVVEIDLEKGSHGLGFSLLDFADPFHRGDKVIIVHSLVPGGVAEMDGRLQVGDRLVSVSGVSVLGHPLQFAVQQLTGVKLGMVKIGVNHSLPTSPDFNSSPISSLDSSHPFFAAEGQSIIDMRSQDEEEGGMILTEPVSQVSTHERLKTNEAGGVPRPDSARYLEDGTNGDMEEHMQRSQESDDEDEGPPPYTVLDPEEAKLSTEPKGLTGSTQARGSAVGSATTLHGLTIDMQRLTVKDVRSFQASSQMVPQSSETEGTMPQPTSQDGTLSQDITADPHQGSSQDSCLTRLSPEASDLSADNEPELREVVVPKGNGTHLGITLSYDDKNRCVVVKTVTNNSAIGKDGRIRIGDRIVSINRKSLEGASLTKAKSILRRAAMKDEDMRITYLPCIPAMTPVVPMGRTLVKASSAGTLGSPRTQQEQTYNGYADGMAGVPSERRPLLPPLPVGSGTLHTQPMLASHPSPMSASHPSPMSQLPTPWQQQQQHAFYVGPAVGPQPAFMRPPPPYTFPSRGPPPPPHLAPPTSYTNGMAWNMADVPQIQMPLPAQTMPMPWGAGIMHRDPPQYPDFFIPNGSGSQSTSQYHPMPRMSKSQSDSRFRSEQAKLQVERRHNSQGTNRTLPVYSAMHQTVDDQQAPPSQPNNQPPDQHGWAQDSEDYWPQEHLTSGWAHDQSVGAGGWSHDQPMGAAGWAQHQMVGGATWSHDKGAGEYTGSKPTWPPSLQDSSPDHSHHNSLALEEEEDTSLRKRYPDVEGHLYAVSLKKGKSGLGLSIVANNQAPRGIVVMGVQRGGVADLSGKVKWGDVILEVNDVSVIGKSQQKFQEMLAQAPVSINLVLVRPPTSAAKHSGNISLEGLAQVRAVTLKREDERGFGIEISEVQGIDGEKSTLVISKITVGSPADRCGQLQTGDQLISVDGQKVLGYSYDKARCLLQLARSHGNVNLIVASNTPGGGPGDSGDPNVGRLQRVGETVGGVVQRLGETQGGVVQRLGETQGGVVQRLGETQGGVVQRLGETQGVVVQRLGETQGGVVQRLGETQGGVASRPNNAIRRNQSRCNPLRQSRRRPVSVDNEKDTPTGDQVTTVSTSCSNRHPLVDKEHGYHQPEKKDITQGEKSGIIIFKGPDPLGITIVGGADTPLNGVYIQRVHPDSPASRDDRLRAGDRILAIGNHTLENMRREEVVQTLQQAGNFVHLTILRQPEGAVETVELVKPDMGGLGLLISEGKDLPGIYVQEVVKNQAAYANGHIRAGDKILSINGQDTTTADQGAVVRLLQTCKGVVVVTVQHPGTAVVPLQVPSAAAYHDPSPEDIPGFHGRPTYPSPSVRLPSHDPPPYTSTSTTMPQPHPRYTSNGANIHQAGSPYIAEKAPVSSPEQGDNMKKKIIKLHRGPSGLGFTIVGGKGSPQGDRPIIINRVCDEGAAARDGRIRAGNLLLAVNGVNFANVTHHYAADTLKYLQGDVELTVLSSD